MPRLVKWNAGCILMSNIKQANLYAGCMLMSMNKQANNYAGCILMSYIKSCLDWSIGMQAAY